jgi:predicted AlkP superfamily pyrophosphatase or phosphodiesterase
MIALLGNLFRFALCSSLSFIFLSTLAQAKSNNPPPHRSIWKKTASTFSGDIFLLTKPGNFLLDDKLFEPKNMNSSTIRGRLLPPHPMTMHGYAHPYDLDIPIAFWDPTSRWIRPGQYSTPATQQDITPTLAKILNAPTPGRKHGVALSQALQPAAQKPPKVIVIFVQDQGGLQYFNAHPGRASFYEKLMDDGANFTKAQVTNVDVETSVGHVAVGTGVWPGEHGVSGNDFFNPGLWQRFKVFSIPMSSNKKDSVIGHPFFMLSATLADVWVQATKGQAKVLSQCLAPRASIGMGGHGALFPHQVKTSVVWVNEDDDEGNTYSTNESIYHLPNAYRELKLRPYVDALTAKTPGIWRGHKIIYDGVLDGDAAQRTPAQTRWEADLAIRAMDELKIGEDDITDLVYIDTKATDTCGHFYGFESDECGDVLEESDRASQRIVKHLADKVKSDIIVVLTADHGAAPMPEISGAVRFSRQQLFKDLNKKFDQVDNNIDVIQAVTSSQIFLNHGELAANKYKTSDVVKYLKEYRVPFKAPYNVLAEEWIRKGHAKEQVFFQDVASKEEL